MSGGRFAGKVALVTGSGRGLGRAVALGLASEGASVVVCSRTVGEVEATAKEAQALGVDALAHPADVRDTDAVDQLVSATVGAFGGVDICINCAGVFALTPAPETTTEQFSALLETNLVGAYTVCRTVGAVMVAAGHGKIVNFASLLSFTAFPQRAAYAASKGGVLQLTRVLGVEWAPHGVNVNAVAPGMIRIETPHPAIERKALSEEQIVARIPAGRRGRPADIVGPTLFLASHDAEYVHGQTLVVDGGWLSNGYV